MSLLEELSDKLAQQALKAVEDIGDNADDSKLIDELAAVIGSSSQTMEEAFLTAVRIRKAEARAHALLAKVTSAKPVADT